MAVSAWSVAAVWLAGLAPAVFLPGALNRFVFLKLAVVAAAWACALMAPRQGRLHRNAGLVVSAGAAILALSAVLGSAPLAQLLGRAPRYEGLVALSVYLGALLIGAWLLGPGPEARLRSHLLRATAVAASLMTAVALADVVGWHLLDTSVSRPGSLLGNATEMGAYGAGVFGLGLGWYAVGPRSRASLIALCAGATLVVLSASRGALLGLAVVLVFALVLGAERLRRVALVAGGVAAAAALIVPLTRDRLLLRSALSEQTISGRAQEWSESLALIRERVILGWGPSGFVDAWPSVRSADYVRLAGNMRLDSPHSLPLQVTLSGGLLLAVAAIALTLLVLRNALRLRKDPTEGVWSLASLLALIGWSTVVLTHFTAPGTAPFFCLLAGALLSEPVVRRTVVWRARVGAAAALGLTGVLLLAAIAEVPLRSGLLALQSGDGRAAQSSFDTARSLRPWDADLDAQIAHALIARPDVAATTVVDAYLGRAASALPADTAVMTDRALWALQRGRLQEALGHLDAAHARSANDPTVYLVRGQVRARSGDVPGAIADLEASAALAPKDPLPLQTLAGLYAETGQTDLAAETLERAQSIGP